MDIGHSNWFLAIPVIIVIVLNVIFLSNVMCILRSKLNISSVNSSSDSRNLDFLKQTRAAMILIPILGLNFLLLPMRPENNPPFERFYDILSTLTSSFQGVFVSFLLCFTNKQVIQALKSRWIKQKETTMKEDKSGFKDKDKGEREDRF